MYIIIIQIQNKVVDLEVTKTISLPEVQFPASEAGGCGVVVITHVGTEAFQNCPSHPKTDSPAIRMLILHVKNAKAQKAERGHINIF